MFLAVPQLFLVAPVFILRIKELDGNYLARVCAIKHILISWYCHVNKSTLSGST